MDTPNPSGSGKVASPQSSVITSHTIHPSGGGMVMDYDQTIKIKTPGSGMTVFGRYKLERVLGRGGMGVVWLADDMKLERPVALKFLPSLIGLDPAAVKELKTETRRGLELSHPHIVRIYDFVDDEDAAAISMEFVDGKTLSELRLATDTGVFSVDQVSQWLLGVCDALDYAHFQRKLIHRDLKPANIMLTTRDSVAKIADFGIARSLSDTMSRLSAANIGTSGTLPYMSPQQAMGERPQPTDDVYSLGATLYELLSGKPPFYRGDLPTQINSKIPPSMVERRQELEIQAQDQVPRIWEEAIAACLAKEPSMRPSCAGALAEMLGLRPSTASVRTGAYNTGLPPVPKTVPPKNSSNAPLIAAAAAVVVGAGAAAYFFLKPNEPVVPVAGNSASTRTQTVAEEPATKPNPAVASPDTEPEAARVTEAPPSTTPAEAVTRTAPPAPVAVDAPPPASTPSSPVTAAADMPLVASVPESGQNANALPTTPSAVTAPATESPGETASIGRPAGGVVMETPPPTSEAGPAAVVAAPTSVDAPPKPETAPPTPGPESAEAAGSSAIASVTMPSAATPGPEAATNAETAPPQIPLPPGFVAPESGLMLTQPEVPPPAGGFWSLEQVFPVPPQASFSEKGKRHLLYKTQSVLKQEGLYTSTLDGAAGKGTHNAILLYQVRKGLVANGLLDLPTLAALNLSAEPDKTDWVPSSGGSGSGYTRRRAPAPKEEPNFFQRTGDTFKKLFK